MTIPKPPASDQRLAIFLPTLAGGGAERVCVTLANQFAALGVPVEMVLGWACGPYLAEIDARVRVVDLGVSSRAHTILALARYLRRERPDVLLSAMDIANVVALLAARLSGRRVRVVVSCHIQFSLQAKHGRRMQDRALPWLARLLYPAADGIVAVSHGVAADLARTLRVGRDRIDVIYNPLDVDAVRARAVEPTGHPWFREGEPPVLLSVGRLVPQKDYPTLLRAVAKVREGRPVRLILLGEGPERANLERLADRLGISDQVSLPGFVDNPFSYMREARLFVLASRWEGFGLVLVEAMACGCPVLSTDCPSGPAEILDGERYGRLTPVGDVEAMAASIEECLDAAVDREALIERARGFDPRRVAALYLRSLGLAPCPLGLS